LPETLPETIWMAETNILPGEYGDIGVLLFSMPEGFTGVSGRITSWRESMGLTSKYDSPLTMPASN